MPSSWLATLLDQEQIELTRQIGPRNVDVSSMPLRSGADVSAELGGRLLARYLVDSQLHEFLGGGKDRGHWVCPTPISPEEVVSWLALFAPKQVRAHALLLDPTQISAVCGPAWIRFGQGIEYYLPEGFEKAAVVDVGVIQVR